MEGEKLHTNSAKILEVLDFLLHRIFPPLDPGWPHCFHATPSVGAQLFISPDTGGMKVYHSLDAHLNTALQCSYYHSLL